MNKRTRISKLFLNIKRNGALYLMILPAIVTVFIFHYIPIYGVQIAFKDYRTSLGIWGSSWVGFKHFLKFFDYPYFGRLLWNTIKISLFSLMTFPLPIIFALLLNEMRNGKLKKVCQTITYAPHFVSTIVVCSMTLLFLKRDGLINVLIGFFGAESIDFISVPSYFAAICAATDLWTGLGWGSIIYIASLSGVSVELVEAARIDGASRMQIIRNVYLPHLIPTIVTMFILRMGSLLSVGFEKVFALQNNLNLEGSSIISTYVYEVGLLNSQFSYSAAIGLFNNIINIILVVLANKICKKVAGIALW